MNKGTAFNAKSHMIQEMPSNILAILEGVRFKIPTKHVPMPPKAFWLTKASEEIEEYLCLLSQASDRQKLVLKRYANFPTEELTQLRATLDEMVSICYESHAEVPVLEKVSTRPCEKLIQNLKRIEQEQPRATSCAKVAVNIKLDELGEELYEVALNGEIRSVEKYVEFKQKSGWGMLRNYLLHAITFEWNKKHSVVQYSVLLDLIIASEEVHKGLTVSLFWLALVGRTLNLVNLTKVLQDYEERSGQAFPRIQQKYNSPAYSWHAGSPQDPQLSFRKEAIYGYRS